MTNHSLLIRPLSRFGDWSYLCNFTLTTPLARPMTPMLAVRFERVLFDLIGHRRSLKNLKLSTLERPDPDEQFVI